MLDPACTYTGLIPTEQFDWETYLHEFKARCANSVPVGAYEFRGVEVSDSWMLLSRNRGTELYSNLPGMGWASEHIQHVVAGPTVTSLRQGELTIRPLPGRYVLLSCPGAFTYGHALVDISIRMQLARCMQLWSGVKMLIPGPTPAWFLPLLSVAGISFEDCISVHNGESLFVEQLYVPTLTGLNGVLNRELTQLAFRRMKGVMNSILGPLDQERRVIFPLHTTMSSVYHPRGVMDREQIARTLEHRFGAEVFNPLELSFAQQVNKFRNASLVLGEDSSALHNVLWSEGADLAVMAPRGRFNYYHIGIQATNGGRCAIHWGDVTDEERGFFRIDLDSFCRTVESMLGR
jgi:hypothetical protein